jgi:glutamate-1-semialdehyde 2,1-aminomutase
MTDSRELSTDGERSSELVSRAQAVVPGGAQTGLRGDVYDLADVAFERADGATLTTADGDEFTDYHLAFGPILLGHGDPAVDAAAKAAIDAGVLYGAGTTEREVEVAERLVDLVPSVEQVNFCNSGSEATYHAIRLSRAHTGNETVLKFEGCYHGWHDYVDTSVHPPADRLGERHPESAGMLEAAVENTVVVPFNDPEAFRAAMAEHADDLAAVILEPVPHSVGCLLPTDEFLAALDEETDRRDVPLVFDEVITAFRHSPNGAQAEFGVTPDLTTMAKAMGNGYPVAAVGGRRDLMEQAGDDGDVVISGTYSGHPVGLAAAAETLDRVADGDVVPRVSDVGDRYRDGLRDLVADHGVDARVVGYRSILSLQFGVSGQPRSYADVVGLDGDRFREYAAGMFERGHFFTPNPHKRHHLSAAHDETHLQQYLDDADEVLPDLAE